MGVEILKKNMDFIMYDIRGAMLPLRTYFRVGLLPRDRFWFTVLSHDYCRILKEMCEIRGSVPEISKTIKKEGTWGRKPGLGWKCSIKLKVINDALSTGIQSEYLDAETAEIVIGDGNYPADKAIESCVETMNPNEESSFNIRIDENSVLDVDITLCDCTEKGYIFQWSDEDKFEASKAYKADGINLFKNNKIDQAFYKFSKALKMLLITDTCLAQEGDNQINEVLIPLYNNLANCQFHFKNYSQVVDLCGKSLSLSPNVKGYFRRALAYVELKEYENAENDLLALLKIEPKNKAAIERYRLVRDLDKQNRENYEAIVRKMFG